MERIWAYNQMENNYQPSTKAPLSTFPTIVNIKKCEVYCRYHHCWEPIFSFSSNVLKAACGKLYMGPFSYEGKNFFLWLRSFKTPKLLSNKSIIPTCFRKKSKVN